MVPVFVISLARIPLRLAAMRRQLDLLGVPFTWIEAIDGEQLSERELRALAPRANALTLRYPLSKSEVAATASHRLAIKRMLDLSDLNDYFCC